MSIEIKWFGTGPNDFHRCTTQRKGLSAAWELLTPHRSASPAETRVGYGMVETESCVENHHRVQIIKWHLQRYLQMFTCRLSSWGYKQSFKINCSLQSIIRAADVRIWNSALPPPRMRPYFHICCCCCSLALQPHMVSRTQHFLFYWSWTAFNLDNPAYETYWEC